MYKYDNLDSQFLGERVEQFTKQIDRYKKNELDEDQFRSLRLRNGLYKELHANMLRVAIPYGVINSKQLNQLALIANKYDKGYGHFTTRQNIQFNWIDLADMPNILKDLADAGLHAIQTSGKSIRNITADPLSGVRTDEIADARPYSEIIRQWFTLHPEFSWLPAKFKIAINGIKTDQIGMKFHDIGLQIVRNENKELGFAVYAGGGLGAAAMLAQEVKSFVPEEDILSYLESLLRTYNLQGRRNNPKKGRIKFLVKELGKDKFSELVEKDWLLSKDNKELKLNFAKLKKLQDNFKIPIKPKAYSNKNTDVDFNFSIWRKNNVRENKISGYSVIFVSLSQINSAPGDISHQQLKALAKLVLKYSCDEARITKKQDIVLPFVKNEDVYELWQKLNLIDLSSPHNDTFAHIVSCPGLDYCSLAKTTSIPIAKQIQNRFNENGLLFEAGNLSLHISGCENSCSHHHVADIGLLGLNKNEDAFYQITLGGNTKDDTELGKRLGRAVSQDEVIDVVEKIVKVYLANKEEEESFNKVFKRIGIAPFKDSVYA
jgi:sulfite reductase (NADPH) hemoprotein beta-component